MGIKYKPTGCTKFLLVLVVLIPLAYFSAKLITGEDPLNNVYELLGKESKESTQIQTNSNLGNESFDSNNFNKDEIEKRILELENELEWLRSELKNHTN